MTSALPNCCQKTPSLKLKQRKRNPQNVVQVSNAGQTHFAISLQSPMSILNALNLGFRKKLPIILQTEAAECGLASLAMVACYHGYVTDLPSLRSRYSISLKGSTLAEIMKVATALKFQTRPLRLDLHELGELKLPCVLHWDLNHFVVLEAVTREDIRIHDPRRVSAPSPLPRPASTLRA